jgi:hypothetical protein
VDLAEGFLDVPLDVAPDVGHGEAGARRTAEEAEGAQVGGGGGVDVRRDVGDGKRGVEDDITGLVAVVHQREVHTGWVRGVGPRLELLCGAFASGKK